jgi:hypothetical protein
MGSDGRFARSTDEASSDIDDVHHCWRAGYHVVPIYQQPDAETLRRVMAGGRKRHEPNGDPEKRQRQRQPHVG